jgi:hypothetical protein
MSYWGEVRQWLCEDPAIAAFTSEGEFAKLYEANSDVRNLWAVVAEYQGFDVKRMIKHLYNKYAESVAEENLMTIVEADITLDGGVKNKFKYTSKENFYKEMAFLILIFATHGSNWMRIREKSSPHKQALMDHHHGRYNFNQMVRKNDPVRPRDILYSVHLP